MIDGIQPPPRIAVIGGGITGLAAAHRLTELSGQAHVTLWESAHQLGGVIRTTCRDGFLVEHSADNFIDNAELPWAGDLCRRIGFQLIGTNPRHRRALILRSGKFYPVPAGLQLMSIGSLVPIWRSPLLSWPAKLRVAWEPFVPRRRQSGDESLAGFATRRLGREAFERIVQPLVSGIYTADPERLSMSAALPQFVAMEEKHGSLVRGARGQAKQGGDESASGARYAMFVTAQRGLSTLIDALAGRLETTVRIRLGYPVTKLARGDWGWQLHSNGGPAEQYDAVILAVPAPAAARLLQPVCAELAGLLAGIEHASSSVVCLGYRRDQIRHPLDAFGCVIPRVEKRRTIAISFASEKFPGRAPAGSVLLRVFVGGALQPELAELPDAELLATAREELQNLLGVSGTPVVEQISRWINTMPQYHVGHCQRVEKIEGLVDSLPCLALAGNAFHGVGIPQCVRSGEAAAAAIHAKITQRQREGSEQGA